MKTLAPVMIVVLVTVVHATSGFADAEAVTMRGVVEKHGDTVVTLKIVITENFSFGGMGSEGSESVMETPATLIHADGLMMTSLSAMNPGSIFEELFSALGGGDMGMQMNFDTQIDKVTIIYSDGEEVPGQIVLRDLDLDLAFVRPDEKPEKSLAHIPLSDGATVEQFDNVMIIGRMGKVADRGVTGWKRRVLSVMERPRLLYFLSEGDSSDSNLGLPVFDFKGKPLGMTALRKIKTGSGGDAFSVLANALSDTAMVVVPIADIVESAEQAPGYEETP